MWTSYFIAVACILGILYIPGYFAFRALRFSCGLSLICAPLASVFAYATLPVIYGELGIACNAVLILVPTVAAFLVAYFASRTLGKGTRVEIGLPKYASLRLGSRTVSFTTAAIVGAVALASVMTYLIFVSNLPTPEAFYSRYDNQTHLNLVQAFVDSGRWSMLHASNFAASPEYASAALSTSGSFYPAAWHDVLALVCVLAGLKVTVASNAFITVICAVVFPLGMSALMCALFPDSRRLVLAGSFVMSMFATWPWVFIIKGPCLPNLLGLSLMVAALAVVVLYVEAGLVRRKLVSFVAFALLSLLALAYAHPNTVFTAYVFLAAYGAHVVNRAMRARESVPGRVSPQRALALGGFIALVLVGWYAFYRLPFMGSVLSYTWSEKTSLLGSLASLGSLSMVISGVQAAMMLICIVGCIWCLRNRVWWLLAPMLFFSICFLVSKSGLNPFKYWLASLWYQTPYRFTACISIFLMPIAAIGLDCICNWADERLARFRARRSSSAGYAHMGALAAIAVFLAVTFMPAFSVPGVDTTLRPGIALTEYRIDEIYRADKEQVYSAEEVAFVYEAQRLIPEGSLVINQPNDGSVFAYGVNQLNTYFRHGRASKKNDTAKVIMGSLSDYAHDDAAREAVRKTGAHYLLQLDQGVAYEDGVWLNQYKAKNVASWAGIDAVRDDTPGFEVLLSEGDMRLYELTAL